MRQALWLVIVLFLAAGLAWAAGEPEVEVEGFTGEVVQDEIEIWWHEGVEAEVHVIEDFVEEFNQTQDEVTAELTLVPEADYAEALRGASAADALPDVIDTDASFAFAYAWGGDLQPLDPGMDDELLDDLLPSIVN